MIISPFTYIVKNAKGSPKNKFDFVHAKLLAIVQPIFQTTYFTV